MNFSFLSGLKISEAIIFFSGGKDSIVSLDLIRNHIDNLTGIYLEYIPGLKYKDELFNYYENRYNFKIIKKDHPFWLLYQQKNVYGCKNNITEKIKLTDLKLGKFYNKYKKELNIEWHIIGEKRTDDITRARKLFKSTPIDKTNKIIYPVALFSDKEIFKYIEFKKLILPIEYKLYNVKHDHNVAFSKEALLFFKNNFIDDYYKILEIFPQIESILKK